VKDRQKFFAATWSEILEFALLIANKQTKVSLSWAPAQSQNDADGWGLVKAKVDAGLPLQRALEEHGYTTEEAEEFAEYIADPVKRIETIRAMMETNSHSTDGPTPLVSHIRAIIMANPNLKGQELLDEVSRITRIPLINLQGSSAFADDPEIPSQDELAIPAEGNIP